jgi:hypothetical protein
MENVDIVPVASLRVKLTQLNGELRGINKRKDEITEEVKHIEYFIENYGNKKNQNPAPIVRQNDDLLSAVEPFDRRNAIECVLKDSGLVMSSSDIRGELERRGTPIPQDSFNSVMSIESRKEDSHIEKVGYGKFKYRDHGDTGTPSVGQSQEPAMASSISPSKSEAGAVQF